MSDKNIKTSEEVDLGQLFKIIGDGFKNMFNGILKVIKSIFHYIILTLIFLKKNAIILGVATVIGAVIGFYRDYDNEPSYYSQIKVLTNYDSANVLYPKIDYINTLISIEDSTKLASIFNISSHEANLLSGFVVEPFEKEKQLLRNYDNFIRYSDTVFTKGYTFERYKEKLNDFSFVEHEITVASYDQKLLPKLSKGIQKLVKTDYLLDIHHKKNEELLLKEKEIELDLKKLDTLRQRYNKVAVLEASKQSVASSLSLSTTSQNSRERNFDMDIFKENTSLVNKLIKVKSEKVKYKDIVTLVTDFSVGIENDSISTKKWIKYAIFGFIISLLLILGLKANKFLNNYSK